MREIKFRFWNGQRMIFRNLFNPFLSRHNTEKVTQYTGLKDKKGNEIYEGDIVELRNCDEDPSEISEVVFTDGGFVVSADFGEYDSTTVGWAMDRDYSIEVIGNIYENPEPLRKD